VVRPERILLARIAVQETLKPSVNSVTRVMNRK
jgi:hypothetical protein